MIEKIGPQCTDSWDFLDTSVAITRTFDVHIKNTHLINIPRDTR